MTYPPAGSPFPPAAGSSPPPPAFARPFGVILLGILSSVLSRKIKTIQKVIVAETTALAGSTTESLRNIELVKAHHGSLSREQRKRAIFWLSQSESDAAQAYLEKVLARNTD